MADSNIKQIIQDFSDLLSAYTDLTQGNWIGDAKDLFDLIKDGIESVSALTGIISDWQSLSDADRADLTAFVEANVLLPTNLSVQAFLQQALEAIINFSKVIQMLKKPVK